MANGPPPSAAESSRKTSTFYHQYTTLATSQGLGTSESSQSAGASQPSSATKLPYTNQASGPTAPTGQYGVGSWTSMQWSGYPTGTTPYGSTATASTAGTGYNPYLDYQNYYSAQAMQIGQQARNQTHYPQPYTVLPTSTSQPTQTTFRVGGLKKEEVEPSIPPPPLAPPTPTPAPTLKTYKHWDMALKDFFDESGLTETMKGFEKDMLIMSSDWEEERIPMALESLITRLKGVSELSKRQDCDDSMAVDNPGGEGDDARTPLAKRKQTYAKLEAGEVLRSPTSINKSISQLLAKNRAKINASNRSEFLYSKPERQRNIQAKTDEEPDLDALGSCARTDARPIDRDEQMKYDIAKNNDGPLSRTMKASSESDGNSSERVVNSLDVGDDEERLTASRYPPLDERLKNIETHFAVRFVPSPPRTLLSRLKLLEEHIIKLEKEYPPWAALHFNQPNRGWPPPPRTTPIIVPVHLRSKDNYPSPDPVSATKSTSSSSSQPTSGASPSLVSASHSTEMSVDGAGSTSKPGSLGGVPPGMSKRNNKSSLHRAVMEKLQVQQALNEISGKDDPGRPG